MTKLQKIKAAVRAGEVVLEGSPNGHYKVKCHIFKDGTEQWLITFAPTDWAIGLTWLDGKTLNGENFYLNGQEILDDCECGSPDCPSANKNACDLYAKC